MAKKSKRPPARKQQQRRPQPPATSAVPQQRIAPSAPVAEATAGEEEYAATALPYIESDGPMPLPPPGSEQAPAEELAPAATPATASAAAPASAGERRRVGRVDPAAAAAQRATQRRGGRATSTAAMFEPLPPEDAAIPFDRVPYVPGDLRRVLIIAGLMVVLIVVANFVINAVVK